MTFPQSRNAMLHAYYYDAADRLVSIQPTNQLRHRRFYAGAVLANELDGALRRSPLNLGGQLSGIREQEGSLATLRLFSTAQQSSVLQVVGAQGQQNLAYTPHGQGADQSLPGFNGEQPDPLTGNYLLGNGYRAYNPTLMRFHSLDSFSPFGGGGFNAYTYCLGDPINRVDPTGHMSALSWTNVGLGVAGVLLGGFMLASGGLSGLPAAVVGGFVGINTTAQAVSSVSAEAGAGSGSSGALGWIAAGVGAALLLAGIGKLAAPRFEQVMARYRVGNLRADLSPPRTLAATRLGPSPEAMRLAEQSALHMGPIPYGATQTRFAGQLMSLLSADDLTSLAATSRNMHRLVFNNVRPLSDVIRRPIMQGTLVRLTETIGSGAMQGMLPAQLTRMNILPSRLPPLFTGNIFDIPRWEGTRLARVQRGINRQRQLRERWGV